MKKFFVLLSLFLVLSPIYTHAQSANQQLFTALKNISPVSTGQTVTLGDDYLLWHDNQLLFINAQGIFRAKIKTKFNADVNLSVIKRQKKQKLQTIATAEVGEEYQLVNRLNQANSSEDKTTILSETQLPECVSLKHAQVIFAALNILITPTESTAIKRQTIRLLQACQRHETLKPHVHTVANAAYQFPQAPEIKQALDALRLQEKLTISDGKTTLSLTQSELNQTKTQAPDNSDVYITGGEAFYQELHDRILTVFDHYLKAILQYQQQNKSTYELTNLYLDALYGEAYQFHPEAAQNAIDAIEQAALSYK